MRLEVRDTPVAFPKLFAETLELAPQSRLPFLPLGRDGHDFLGQPIALGVDAGVGLGDLREELVCLFAVVTTKPARQGGITNGVGCDLRHELKVRRVGKCPQG